MENDEKKSSPIKFRMEAIQHMWDRHGRYTLNGMIPTYSWGYLLFICAVLLCLSIWGVIGTVSDYVTGEGLILTKADSISNVSSPAGINQIKEIHFKQGQSIKVGDTIATFSNPELESQIPIYKNKLEFFTSKIKEYQALSEKEISERSSLIDEQKKLLDKIIATESKNIEQIEKLMSTQDFLSSKGLIRIYDKRAIQQQFTDSQRSLENSNTQMISNNISLNAFKNEWHGKIRNLQLQEQEARFNLHTQQEKLSSASEVKALVSGKLIFMDKKSGDFVRDGEPIATIAALSSSAEMRAIIYIPGQVGKKVKPGMRVLVSPTIIKKEEYGSIEGEIEEVSEYPVNPQEIMSTLKNETIVKTLTSKEAPIKAIVKLRIVDGQLKWSSSQGPGYPITEGTYVTTNILVQQQSPISLVIPAFKKLMGVS
jgi:HlyD family secretion protein